MNTDGTHPPANFDPSSFYFMSIFYLKPIAKTQSKYVCGLEIFSRLENNIVILPSIAIYHFPLLFAQLPSHYDRVRFLLETVHYFILVHL